MPRVDKGLTTLRLLFFPYRSHTAVSLVVRDWKGNETMDRRMLHCDLPMGRDALDDLDPKEMTRVLCAMVLRAIGTPNPRSLPEAPEPPDGGYGGEQVAGQRSLPGLV